MQITIEYRNGKPYTAESDRFTWFVGNDSSLHEKSTGSAIIGLRRLYRDRIGGEQIQDQETISAVRAFWDALDAAVAAEQISSSAQNEHETPASADPVKAAEYDLVFNEGGEGYNPYR